MNLLHPILLHSLWMATNFGRYCMVSIGMALCFIGKQTIGLVVSKE